LDVLFENSSQISSGDTDAGIPYGHQESLAAPTTADQHAPLGRVFDRVRHEVAQDPLHQVAVRSDDGTRWKHQQSDLPGSGLRREVNLYRVQDDA
jgi:hypothetical protein